MKRGEALDLAEASKNHPSSQVAACPAPSSPHTKLGSNGVAPGRFVSLADMPVDVLESICRHLPLPQRVVLTSCCATSWARPDVLGSTSLWGELLLSQGQAVRTASLSVWLSRRRSALWRLYLSGQRWGPELVLASLGGSPLVELGLSNTPVGKLGDASLQPMRHLPSLTLLDLTRCRLERLPAQLSALATLAALDVSNNGCLGLMCEAAFQPLRHLRALTRLGLASCRLTRLPAELAALRCLVALDVSSSHLGMGGELALQPLRYLSALTRLDLNCCGLSSMPPELSALGALVELQLGYNFRLGSEGHAAFRPLQHVTTLTRLLLVCCNLPSLPFALSALTALEELHVSNNTSLGVRGWAAFQPLQHLGALTRLSMSGCSLLSAPPKLSALAKLCDLDLSYNASLGRRGALLALQPLWGLRRLDVRNCSLQILPPQLVALSEADVVVRWK